jgi:isopropylmalate/homocitrate/citramalate synthase
MERFMVSPFNLEAEGSTDRKLPKEIVVYDTTLRDGEQMPGVRFTLEQKLDIARRLAAIGLPQIEAGFPAVSTQEREAVRAIVKEGLGPKILVLSRLLKEDIDAAVDTGADIAMLFVATSELHLKNKLRATQEDIRERLATTIAYARERGMTFSFTPEDATRSDWGFQEELLRMAVEAGAYRIGIADTTGSATPEAVAMLVRRLTRLGDLPVSLHLHNDFGLALANALAGIREGATHINASVSGIGERAGNVPIEQLITALQVLYGIDLGIDMSGLTGLSRKVAEYAGIKLSGHMPLVGNNAFSHESGIHVAAVLTEPATYEPIPPSTVGNKRRFLFGKHSGRTAIRLKLEEKGLGGDDALVEKVLSSIKAHGEANGGISEEAFWSVVDRAGHEK